MVKEVMWDTKTTIILCYYDYGSFPGGASSVGRLFLFISILFMTAFALYGIVWWQVRQKRQALEIITISQRQLYQKINITATIFLICAIFTLCLSFLNMH